MIKQIYIEGKLVEKEPTDRSYIVIFVPDMYDNNNSVPFEALSPKPDGSPNRIIKSSVNNKDNDYLEEQWWENGKLSRLDGPALIRNYIFTGSLYEQWYIKGENFTDRIMYWLNSNNIDWRHMSDREKLMCILKWAE